MKSKGLVCGVKVPRGWALIAIGLLVSLMSCEEWFGDDDDDDPRFRGDMIADHLDTPWEMAFASDGRLFFSQRPGVIDVVENGEVKVWAKLDSVVEEIGESGLLGLALHPEFAQNRYVYFAYTYAESKSPLKLVNKIVRYRDEPSTKSPVFD
ncbi:MAG TPA: PQQ-dependent sugar dehydrogenase, partial [Chryseolinea sp.]